MIAHVGPVPLEEILSSVVAGSTGLALARAWLAVRLRDGR